MLYITTRNSRDVYTSHKALTENFAADGGGYAPFRLPELDLAELRSLADKPFADCVASVLNFFFSSKLTAWDVEFTIGRNPVKTIPLSGKITVAELYSNPEEDYSYFVKALYNRLIKSDTPTVCATEWVEIAVRIATLFGLWSDMVQKKIVKLQESLDVSVSCENVSTYIAALYAKKMGLPVGVVILSCCEGHPVWDLVSRGEVRASAFSVAESKAVERLLSCVFNSSQSAQYLNCRDCKNVYTLSENDKAFMKDSIFTAVVGSARAATTISNVFKKDGYLLTENTAGAYGGLEDFRAQLGISRQVMLIAESRI